MSTSARSATRPKNSIWSLGGLSLWQLAQTVLKDAKENELFERASGLAFDFLFALFPLLFILLAGFNLFASQSLPLRTSLLAYFADLLPAMAFQLLKEIAEELAANSAGEKLVIGIVAGLWFVSTGVVSVISSLNAAFRIKESRSWLRVRAIALVLTVVISILTIAALGLVLISGSFVDWIGKEFHLASTMIVIWKAMQWPTALVFVIFSYGLIYRFGPDLPEEFRRWVTPGSIFAAMLWMAASVGFRIYLQFVNNYTLIFGSLGAAAILLVWLYVTSLAFLIGGEIDASIERAIGSGTREKYRVALKTNQAEKA